MRPRTKTILLSLILVAEIIFLIWVRHQYAQNFLNTF
jgi:hypothetical protein